MKSSVKFKKIILIFLLLLFPILKCSAIINITSNNGCPLYCFNELALLNWSENANNSNCVEALARETNKKVKISFSQGLFLNVNYQKTLKMWEFKSAHNIISGIVKRTNNFIFINIDKKGFDQSYRYDLRQKTFEINKKSEFQPIMRSDLPLNEIQCIMVAISNMMYPTHI